MNLTLEPVIKTYLTVIDFSFNLNEVEFSENVCLIVLAQSINAHFKLSYFYLKCKKQEKEKKEKRKEKLKRSITHSQMTFCYEDACEAGDEVRVKLQFAGGDG